MNGNYLQIVTIIKYTCLHTIC